MVPFESLIQFPIRIP